MKMYTKLFIAGIVFFLLAVITRFTMIFSVFCFLGGFILLIIQGITEITDKSTAPSKKEYDEARKAYEEVTKKQKKNNTPPWEE